MTDSLSTAKKLVPIREAAKILGVSIDTIRRWDKSGILHASRPDGKTRHFSVDELEKVKFSQPLSISDASKQLEISQSTLRRLEKKGLIVPQRTAAGERLYTKETLEKFLHSEYFLRQKEVEEKILEPLNEPSVTTPEESRGEVHDKGLHAVAADNREKIIRLLQFRKMFYASGLFLLTTITLLVIVITIAFLLFPEDTAAVLGYRTKINETRPEYLVD